MNEDAQAALLKTLEEPPAGRDPHPVRRRRGAAAADDPLALRPGPARAGRVRDIEAILAEHGRRGRADRGPPRPGGRRPARLALAWAAAPEAVLVRDELARTLLDLLDARPAARLAAVAGRCRRRGRRRRPSARPATRPAAAPTGATARTAAAAAPPGPPPPPTAAERRRRRRRRSTDADDGAGGAATPAAERRRAAEALLGLWRDLARDLALCRLGGAASRPRSGPARRPRRGRRRGSTGGRPRAFLDRLGARRRAARGNVAPELVLDAPPARLAAPRGAAA